MDDLADLMQALLVVPDVKAREGLMKQIRCLVELYESAGFAEKRVVVIVQGKPASKPPGDPRAAEIARQLSKVIEVTGIDAVNKLASYQGKPIKERNPYEGWARLQRALGDDGR